MFDFINTFYVCESLLDVGGSFEFEVGLFPGSGVGHESGSCNDEECDEEPNLENKVANVVNHPLLRVESGLVACFSSRLNFLFDMVFGKLELFFHSGRILIVFVHIQVVFEVEADDRLVHFVFI